LSAFRHGAGFRICGAVIRRWVSSSGKFATLTLDVSAHPRSKKIQVRAFDQAVVAEIAELGAGQTVEVTGQIDADCLKNKAKAEVKVDGYPVWVFPLTVKALKVEGASRRPQEPAPEPQRAPEQQSASGQRSFDSAGPADRFSNGNHRFS